jgi:hypothetical protein
MSSQAKYFLLVSFFTFIVLAAGFGIYKLGKSHMVTNSLPTTSQPALSDEQAAGSVIGQVEVQKKVQSPTIAFDNSGGISDADKNQILQKVINPYADYYRDAGQGTLISLTVTLNTQPNNVAFPFLGIGTFDTGVKNSFVIERKGADISWWIPQCQGPCLLTDEFRTKYPEVVKSLGQ